VFSRSKAGPRGAGKGATYSFIGPEVVVTGDIATPGQLHVDGKVVGDVSCGTLSQGDGGEINGNILADEARLAGLIDGAVSAGSLLLEPTARVTGDVLYETLTVSTGAQVDGRFKRRQGGEDGSSRAKIAAVPAARDSKSDVVASPTPGLFSGRAGEQAAEAAE
jgi:cytoskeletal protein CcmA (bactofilin family)